MNRESDHQYFARRAAQERAMEQTIKAWEKTSEDNAVAIAHLRIAEVYECHARELRACLPEMKA